MERILRNLEESIDDLIGQSIGRYHILEQLGEGGMATVYKAFDTRLEREVALKIILPTRRQSHKFLKRFEREAKALAQLSHPNIVNIYDYGEHEGLPYLVMEYTPAGTLKDRLGEAMASSEVSRLLAPVARALEYAHAKKIVHRDVKPSNILITQSGELMLSDFGIAKVLEAEETWDLTGTGVGIGTPEYMAPEQGMGKRVDHRVDIYALGIVLYELVTGRKPFRADTPLAVLLKQVNDPLPRPRGIVPDLPREVERVILKALAKDATDRFQTMQQFTEALSAGVSKPPSEFAARFPRGRLLKVGVAVAAISLLLTITFFMLGQFGLDAASRSSGEVAPTSLSQAAAVVETERSSEDTLQATAHGATPTAGDEAIAVSASPTFEKIDLSELAIITVERAGDLEILAEIETHNMFADMVWSPKSEVLVVASEERVSLHSLDSRQLDTEWDAPAHITDLDITADGKLLAGGLTDGRILLWNLDDGTLIRILGEASSQVDTLLNAVAISPTGAKVAGGNPITLWDMRSGNPIRTLVRGDPGSSLAISRDEVHLASGGSLFYYVWRVRDGFLVHDNIEGRGIQGDVISDLAFSPDTMLGFSRGFLALGYRDGSVELMRLSNGQSTRTLEHSAEVRSLSYSPDGALLAVGTADGKVTLWSVGSEAQPAVELVSMDPKVLIPQHGVSFSPSGKLLAISAPAAVIQLWGIRQ